MGDGEGNKGEASCPSVGTTERVSDVMLTGKNATQQDGLQAYRILAGWWVGQPPRKALVVGF